MISGNRVNSFNCGRKFLYKAYMYFPYFLKMGEMERGVRQRKIQDFCKCMGSMRGRGH